ncbi:ATPase domain-containing protein [Oscillatoria sp. CS-180]|uniref:ATPase domain-containing protein n=1 Tax=Oscillatoria sp. CS-180 TaxID=3021720 RepID=UPI00232D88D0|nr:ATPase domain-containing protein [Oscillatoria sp. CS-180]MDB9527975.1 ATPase domain-containing protein [Oscillatoria sp. CS-180]
MKNDGQLIRISTGITSLNDITCGGLPKGEIYVVNGAPGAGKTILGLHFLQAGIQAGEKVLCIALSQRVQSLQQTATSVGIDTSGIVFEEFSTPQALEVTARQQTVFDTSEVELEEMMTYFTKVIEAMQPQRVMFDGIEYLRMLANDALVYRRNLLILRDYMYTRNITVMLTDTQEVALSDLELVSTVHGIITLFKETTDYGQDYHYLQVSKIRGSDFQSGIHDLEITNQGMRVYPIRHQSSNQIPQISSPTKVPYQLVSSGVEPLDKLIGDHLLTGTSCLFIGPSGTGKTTIASLFIHHFIKQGGKASVFLFDELATTFLERSKGLGIGLDRAEYSDQIRIHELGLSNSNLGKFTHLIDREIKEWGARIVLIDSLTGYVNSMPSTQKLITQLHDLLIALNRQNVLTLLVVAQHGVIGNQLSEEIDISYLADAVLLLRHFEAQGALHRAIGVYKKRYGTHETRIREVQLSSAGIHIGEPLEQFIGVLSGIPNYIGDAQSLMDADG